MISLKNILYLYKIRNYNFYTDYYFSDDIIRPTGTNGNFLAYFENNYFGGNNTIFNIDEMGYSKPKYLNNTKYKSLQILSYKEIDRIDFVKFKFIDRIFYKYITKKSRNIITDSSYSNLVSFLSIVNRENKFDILLK